MVWREGERTGVEEASTQRDNTASIVTSKLHHEQIIQSGSKLLSWFPFIGHGNTDNNLE
jgi:hypothetical protein